MLSEPVWWFHSTPEDVSLVVTSLSPEIGIIALSLPVVWLLWMAARKVVKWGWFLFFAVIGYGIAKGLEVVYSKEFPVAAEVLGALSFASALSAIRARIARLVGIAFVITVGWLLAHGYRFGVAGIP
jgi:hypothetical protein